VTREIRVDRLTGRMVHDSEGRKAGRIRELVAEVERPGSGEYVVREFHLSLGGLIEALGGYQLAGVLSDRFGRHPNRIVVGWRDLDLSNPEQPRLLRPLAEIKAEAAGR
jgi:hypothetical protein